MESIATYNFLYIILQIRVSSDTQEPFTALDYVAPTPEWAVIGHSQRGFDPCETRWYRKNKNKDMGGC